MPFIQRVVQPIYVAQVNTAKGPASAAYRANKYHCAPGKCENCSCINKQESRPATNGETSRTTASVKDTQTQQVGEADLPTPTSTTTITTAIIHSSSAQTNGFASSFSYATDNEEEAATPTHAAMPPLALPMKKLKQHVEFLSSAPSPSRSLTRSSTTESFGVRSSQRRAGTSGGSSRAQSPLAPKVVSGYEFDSISNITLSNALRQLASLVLIASDIFDDLQRELQGVGDRARVVQRKIIAVEQRVCAYDPKTVTVPESDLLTFAQRKTHYESDKSFLKELFTAETRPCSVRVLYDDAGKITPPTSATTSPHRSTSFAVDGHGGLLNGDGSEDPMSTGATTAAGSDELVCTPVFGKANRKMRTRIDAEIEIRLPAAIEDLRKWTSSEALGDVTVTPDCMHHVDTSISTSVVIGDNGVLTPALSPSVLSADAVDALYSINVSNAVESSQIPNDINKDVPLNHRLPSPEEQCKIIALRYPAEVISVDTSGKRFERMCLARKSTTGCFTNIAEANNLNDDVQTVSRRSRSRKVRGKRRNTIAGIDQKEIQDAANGDSTAASGEIRNALVANDEDARRNAEKSKKFGRSKSSDILKKESVALPYDKGKNTLTRLNSLKQWGRNRFKFMQRNDGATLNGGGNSANSSGSHDTSGSSQHTLTEKTTEASSSAGVGAAKTSARAGDIDDECVVHELISQRGEGRFSHERKPSYSSSEKSMSVSSSGQLKGKLHLATCGNVKLRDTSSLNRQRRNGIMANGLGGKEEQPHSSSGNWSASSESGRASIGSEITIQPKSSASNTSLNVSSFHPGSGPPSSMMSRRRFLNTSASSSVTSEGTATPDLQVGGDGAYPNHLDDETSSAYSCDTEGYYTSFHMDSGLRTLKEEDPPATPLQISSQNLHTSNYSFGSGQSNQTTLTAENEYELFGRGSTSTTTSSAGTVCTTLMVHSEQSSLNGLNGPDVPERVSSLGKLSRGGSHNSNSASSSTLERSYSSSTMGSTLERTSTIKRNLNAASLKVAPADGHLDEGEQQATVTPDSQEDEFDFEQRVMKRGAQPLPVGLIVAEVECSESSDLEGVERIERIKQKTALNAKRIPSMCIITPTTSDDENHAREVDSKAYKIQSNESAKAPSSQILQVKINGEDDSRPSMQHSPKDHNLNILKKPYGLNNMLEKLKVVLPHIKRSPSKSLQPTTTLDDDDLYDAAGEYVTIADISNNNRHNQLPAAKAVGASSLGIYYSNDIVRQQAASAAKGNEPVQPGARTEYVSLNELPPHLRKASALGRADDHIYQEANEQACAEATQPQPSDESSSVPMYAEIGELREKALIAPLQQHKGARVRVNEKGKFIYDSDSLKRRKGAHTTFAPGPYVKETESALHAENSESAGLPAKSNNLPTTGAKLLLLNGGIAANRKVANVRPIVSTKATQRQSPSADDAKMPLSTGNIYLDQQHAPPAYSTYQDNKNLLANTTNPFFQSATGAMMPSPSTKSTSSTGSSTASSHTSGSTASTSSSKEEGYQRLFKAGERQPPENQPRTGASVEPFQRNAPIYWTLQNRRQTKPLPSSTTSRDDLYATPIRRSERMARAAAAAAAAEQASGADAGGGSYISPIVPCNRAASNGFLTSTPTKTGGDTPTGTPTRRHSSWSENSPERLNTCADRIGQSKTSLLDFKKLLLAKSAKSSPVQKKLSAVELLKKNSAAAAAEHKPAAPTNLDGSTPLNSSMKLLDLSGSPKTFANRRMLRQGQFGSPSKSFVPKVKTSPATWRNNAGQRSDIISTTIPEANSEEDHSNTSGGSSSSSKANSVERKIPQKSPNEPTSPSSLTTYDLKRNFFLQTEENNFMRGERLQPTFGKPINPFTSNNKPVAQNKATATVAPALETAL